jgi:hypothetical protein
MADGDELRRIGVRLAQLRQARTAELAAAITAARQTAPALVGAHRVGAVVFDTVSGQEGVIVGGTAENVVVPGDQRPAR